MSMTSYNQYKASIPYKEFTCPCHLIEKTLIVDSFLTKNLLLLHTEEKPYKITVAAKNDVIILK